MDGLKTPVLDKCMRSRIRGAQRAYRELGKEHRSWLEAYRNQDIKKVEAIAKKRDARVRRVITVYERADTFFDGVWRLWQCQTPNSPTR
ncbi:hypothetical protein M1278_01365 [Candidatus Marsarchaeota archaeon]|nr:hypothetical protein [Candidatus Marsarchaeota archaeon]